MVLSEQYPRRGGHSSGGEFSGCPARSQVGKRPAVDLPAQNWAFPICEIGVNKEKDQLIWEVPAASCKVPVPHRVLGYAKERFPALYREGEKYQVSTMLNTFTLAVFAGQCRSSQDTSVPDKHQGSPPGLFPRPVLGFHAVAGCP